ncbi:MAG: GxxExxY protein [Ignavibacteria bacterium]|nr:GxxExxY protein [Ignavibacteria bacterium]
MNENELSNIVIGLAIDVHKNLGPGLLESTYEECLFFELVQNGLQVEKQKSMPLKYKDITLECGYRTDLIVENKLIIEIKSCDNLLPVHNAQLQTYLKLSKMKLGLLINFNVKYLKEGIKRVINNDGKELE